MEELENIVGKDIVIYGLSTETELTLKKWSGKYNVIGLLDGFKTSGEQFGYPILDINDVVKLENIIIIVVARPGSCKAIAKRIGERCRKNNVKLYDIRGNDLLADVKVVYDFKEVQGYTKADLLKSVESVAVISFDLFDTLVTRDIFSFSGMLELIDVRFAERGIYIPNFGNIRLQVEKQLSVGRAPRLTDIYKEIMKVTPEIEATEEELANIEYFVDLDLIEPRGEVIELLKNFRKNGHLIYITSDSYYSQSQIEEILAKNGIKEVDGVLVSCEYGTAKTNKLFEQLISIAGTKNILHIGDDYFADIESANRYGISAFQIYSSSELLYQVGGLKLTDEEYSISDQIRIGMFISNIFNSPFQFEEEKKIHVDDTKNVGYLFCAPMIMDFVKWFGEEVERVSAENVWFCARDGYLLKEIYKIMYPSRQSEYFYTSRISSIRAGVDKISDIVYIDSMKYSGKYTENLRTRFGIEAENLDINQNEDGLLRYSKAILEAAKQKKINNLKYIEKLNVNHGTIAFFDFVAKGTSQMYIEKLVDNHIKGLYFLQLEPEFMKDKGLDITSFYTEEEREHSAIFEDYYILETLLTSPEASIEEFDENGEPMFASETRTQKDIDCFMRTQEGILEYVRKYIEICPTSEMCINKKLDEVFLTLIHNIEIRDKDFLSLIVEDPFFNRMTDITDVL